MRIASVHYERKKNLGNYEHETMSAEVVVEEGEDPNQAMSWVRDLINYHLQIRQKIHDGDHQTH